MRVRLLLCLASVLIVSLVVGASAFGQTNLLEADPGSPNYNNPSFETPDVAPGPTSVSLAAPPWTLTGPRVLFDLGPPIGPVPLNPGCGIFENPATVASGRITNAHGTQLAYLFANSYPDVLTNQPVDHAFTQILSTTFQPGNEYALVIGIAHAQQQPPPDSVLTMSLFAFDSGNSSETLLASDTITIGEINGLTLTDFTALTAPISGGNIGKQIGIRISTHTAPKLPSATGQFDFDNVRVYIPEPASATLLAGSAIFAFAARRRRQ